MKDKIKNIIVCTLCAIIIFGFSVWGICKKSDLYSESERRVLSQFPELSIQTLISSKFMTEFEEYTLDQFPLRDVFRSIKANTVFNALFAKDNNDIYTAQGHLSKMEYPLRENALSDATDTFDYIRDTYLGDETDVYLSIIPDKNVFLAEKHGYLSVDYNKLIETVRKNTAFAEYIDITDLVSLEDFYRTDTHWKQESVVDVAGRLCEKMGVPFEDNFVLNTVDGGFRGVYLGQSALNIKPDTLNYLTNEATENCTVTSYDTGVAVEAEVYDMEAATGRDGYEMFLCGADALVVIENENAKSDEELVIFRDSFAGSLTPLIIDSYAKITMVDLRYVKAGALKGMVDFESADDVLFLYSTMLLNTAGMFGA